jgi:hypothetical protein
VRLCIATFPQKTSDPLKWVSKRSLKRRIESVKRAIAAIAPSACSQPLFRGGCMALEIAIPPFWENTMPNAEVGTRSARQLLHLVFGGELKSLRDVEFANLSQLDIVGIYPNYAEAYKAWKAVAQRTVDNAHMRYFIVHIHRLLDPGTPSPSS